MHLHDKLLNTKKGHILLLPAYLWGHRVIS